MVQAQIYHGNFIQISTFRYFLPPNYVCYVNDVHYAAGFAQVNNELNKDHFEFNENCA